MTEIEETKLDRKRSFGVVYGEPNIGFMQDNKPYRHDGTAYAPNPTAIPTVRADQLIGVTKVLTATTETPPERPLTHSEKMKKVWEARRVAEAQDANTSR